MVGHKLSLNKFTDWDHTKYIPQPQLNEIRKQQQRKFGEFTNIWKLNNPFPNNQGVKEETTREIRKCLEIKDNKSSILKNLWDTPKAVVIEKFRAVNIY